MRWLRRTAASTGDEAQDEPAASATPSAPVLRGLSRPFLSQPILSHPTTGLLIWGSACLLPLDGSGVAWWAGRFVLLAALVWVPLALPLVEGAAPIPLAHLLQVHRLWCALLLVGSFLSETGPLAVLLAIPWAGWAVLLGVRGLLRLREYPPRAADELCLSLGMIAFPVGGIWLLAARAGVPLLGFVAPFTLLTGMHFHYAGLLMPTVVGLTGRLLGLCERSMREKVGDDPCDDDGWRLYRALAPAVCGGVWLVAVGITLGGLAEAVAGVLFATLLACTGAVLLLRAPRRIKSLRSRLLLSASLLATWPAMALAALYALSRIGLASVGLETMAVLHGPLLAIVFVGGGLTGLARIRPASRVRSCGQPALAERSA